MRSGTGSTATVRAARVLALAAALGLGANGLAFAQETRAEVIAREKAEKAQNLRPYEPGRAERLVTFIGSGLLAPPSGVFPAFGSVYSGGGFALGPGVRVYHGDRSFLEARALISVRSYKLLEAASIWPGLGRGRMDVRLQAGWLDATQVGFYGRGMDTVPDDGANFRMKQTYGGGEFRLRAAGPLVLGAGLALEQFDISDGSGRRPPISERFTGITAPGLGADPTFVHATTSAGIDTRPAAGYARRGTLLEAEYHAYRDRDDAYSFSRLDATAVQHLPLFREAAVLSLRGRMQTTLDDDAVPFFLLPALGSGSTLRAYSTGRFRDRHALLLQAEWRWVVNRAGLDMAIFYDAGKVASRRAGLDLDGLESNAGIGLRFHGPGTTPLRVELARGREGFNLVFAGSAAF
jgi:hypothetical protein